MFVSEGIDNNQNHPQYATKIGLIQVIDHGQNSIDSIRCKLPFDKRIIINNKSQGQNCLKNSMESNIPAFPVPVIESIATGDCFVGTLAAEYCEGRLLVSAAEFASTAAAISVTWERASLHFMDKRSKSK